MAHEHIVETAMTKSRACALSRQVLFLFAHVVCIAADAQQVCRADPRSLPVA